MTDYYYLMHKNIKVMAFSLKDKFVLDKKVNKDAEEYLPPMYKDNIQSWLDGRIIPVTREGIQEDLKNITPFSLMLKNLGLSLTDCYWINPVNKNYKWEDVNLYNNDFRDSFSLDITIDNNETLAGKTNFSPSYSLKGDLKKKWLIDSNGTRFLVKGNSLYNYIQSLSEVLASEIYKKQGFNNYVSYKLTRITSSGREITSCF